MNKKVLIAGLSTALVASTLFSAGTTAATPAEATTTKSLLEQQYGSMYHSSPANTDRLVKAYVKSGKIAPGLTPEQNEKELNKILSQRAGAQEHSDDHATRADVSKKLRGEAQGGTTAESTVAPAQAQAWDGSLTKDKVLVLLTEFSDYEHSNITADETDMYYDEYPREHFQNMIFNMDGYTLPNGKNGISMSQYYLQQSGGSYTVEGGVTEWVKVDKPAAYYGGNDASDNDSRPRELVRDALAAAVAKGVDLSQYDVQDQYDLDGDGNLREADGLVDHLMVLHAGVGEEAGGGKMGADAIWSHRWNLGGVFTVPGSSTSVPYWGGKMGAYDYTIEPEDGATGVMAHEFGHDLGLPDEYDTAYTGAGEPISYYSIMSSGSWAGAIGGTEPTGFSPLMKEYFQNWYGGNWQHGKTVNFSDIPATGVSVTLDEAVTKGKNEDVVRVNLPDQVRVMNTPFSGSYEYYGGKGDEIDNTMVKTIDLTGKTSATLEYDAWYRIESQWDYAFVQVSTDNGATWNSLSTPNTSSDAVAGVYPTIAENLPGYTGYSNGWKHESIDLSAYAGQKIQVQFRYITDWGTNEEGFFVDNVKATADDVELFNDGAEGTPTFALHGFEKHEGKNTTKHYYLVEWRTHNGVDAGLAHITRGYSNFAHDQGMLVWYVNEGYDNNWVGVHPGFGFNGVVDSHTNVHHWGGNVATGDLASTRYQIFDAAFSLKKGVNLDVDYGQGQHLSNAAKAPVAVFNDKTSYITPPTEQSGLHLPTYGLKITVTGEAADRSAATIKITK